MSEWEEEEENCATVSNSKLWPRGDLRFGRLQWSCALSHLWMLFPFHSLPPSVISGLGRRDLREKGGREERRNGGNVCCG